MSEQPTNTNRNTGNSIRESRQWFLGGGVFLAMLLSNFSATLSIPAWVFYTVAFTFTILLVMLSPPWETWRNPSEQTPRNLGRIPLYMAFFLAIAEVAWFGFVQKEWQLLTVWLPMTLLVGVLLNLVIMAGIEKGIPFRFLVIPSTSLLLGGLIGFIIPDFGFANGFQFSFIIFSLAIGLWLHFRPENGEESVSVG